MAESLGTVDHSSLRVNQAAIIVLLVAAYVANFPWLSLFVAGVMLAGTLVGRPGFLPLYAGVLRPLGIVKPDPIPDNPQPHRFAQGFGGVVAAAAGIACLLGGEVLGWVLAWIVVALAALNLFAGFCAGCAVYYWLNRLGVPGFAKNPPEGTFPGMRPKRLGAA